MIVGCENSTDNGDAIKNDFAGTWKIKATQRYQYPVPNPSEFVITVKFLTDRTVNIQSSYEPLKNANCTFNQRYDSLFYFDLEGKVANTWGGGGGIHYGKDSMEFWFDTNAHGFHSTATRIK